MAGPQAEVDSGTTAADGVALEATLRQLFAERTKWRELRDQAQEELNRLNREVLRIQDKYCTDEAREAECRRCVERLTGTDLSIDLKAIEEAKRDGITMEQILEELKKRRA